MLLLQSVQDEMAQICIAVVSIICFVHSTNEWERLEHKTGEKS